MKKLLSVTLSLILAVTSIFVLPVSSYAAVNTTTINLNKKYQTMNGFGASACWWAKDVGGWENLDDVMSLLYDKENGIGLNIYRYNLGTGSVDDTVNYGSRATETFINPDLETYDWSRDANAQKALAAARKYAGDDMRLTLFCNSAPIYMTRNGHATGNYYWWDVCNLDTTANSRLFAQYGYDCVDYFQSQGYRVTDISPVNEPYGHWCQYPVVDENGNSVLDENGNEIPNGYAGQEGCTYYEQDVLKVNNAFVEKFKGSAAAEKGCKVSMFEANDMANNDGTFAKYLNVLVGTGGDVYKNNKAIRSYLDTITMHSYFSTREGKLATAKLLKDTYGDKLRVAQTEYCQMNIDLSNDLLNSLYEKEGMTSGLGIDYGIALANVMYDDLTIFDAVEWDWWVAVAYGGYTDGLVYANEATHELEASKRLYTMGNFSKFTDEGSVRVGASTTAKGLKTIAFANPDGTVSVVFINDGATDQKTTLSVNGLSGCCRYTTYVTDKTRNLEKYQTDKSNSGVITVPKYSITTAVLQPSSAHSTSTTVTPATLDKNGTVNCAICGKAKAAIYSPKTFTLSAKSYTYDGKAKKPTVTVKDSKGNKIASSNYTLTYSNNKNVGKASVKIAFKNNYTGVKTLYFTINPKGTTISSLSAGKKKLTVKVKKQTTQTTGYQIQYATNSKFTSAKSITVGNSTTSKAVTGLKAKQKYFVRVRTYKTVNGTKYYSTWSTAKTVTTK